MTLQFKGYSIHTLNYISITKRNAVNHENLEQNNLTYLVRLQICQNFLTWTKKISLIFPWRVATFN